MIKKLIPMALSTTMFTGCLGMQSKGTPPDKEYGTSSISLSHHFHKKSNPKNVPTNGTNDRVDRSKGISFIPLTKDRKLFEYNHIRYMSCHLRDLIVGVTNQREPELIQKDGVQNFNYEDFLEALLFLNNKKHYDGLKFLCESITNEYSGQFKNYGENAVFLRNGNINYCLYGLPYELLLQYIKLGKSEIVKSLIIAEISLKVTPRIIGSYYQRAVVKICNDFLRRACDDILQELDFILKILLDLNIDSNFLIPCSNSTVLEWFSSTASSEEFQAIEEVFLKYNAKKD